ncbi:MAG: 2-C-methyl-D-erythritol 2,4-cyclodiphosphate synthase [Opitutae bacterium]
MRIGTGYDIHRLVEDRRLVIGGVEIPYHKGLLGHSDADVLSHAIADAILGAAGLHDIGHFFPDTDPKLEGIDSQIILRKAIAEVSHLGYKLQNVDSTLIAQEPKIGPHINSMKRVLSNSLGATEDSIGIKATTNEGVGDIGKGLAIAAQAACLLVN